MNRLVAVCLARLIGGAALAVLLAACGGDDDDGTPPVTAAPPVEAPAGPNAAFTAAASAVAFAPVAFDASASTSGDGGSLQYVWNFGDGQRGGGAKIAHAFAGAGTPSVTLTVIDAAGRQATHSQGVTVSAAGAAAGAVTVHVAAVDSDGAALSGVAIASPGAAAPLATTDVMGRVDLALDRRRPLTLRLSKGGYADQFLAVELPAGAGTDTRIDALLRPRDAAQTLADAKAGGTLTGRAGATITLPAEALVDGAGTAASGEVDIAMTAVDPTLPRGGGFPGRFDGVHADGKTTPIVSLGTVEFVLSAAGQRLQLAPGKTATIEIPIQAAMRLDGTLMAVGDSTPLWSLDETTAMWIEEGTGTVVANAGSPSGLALRAVVSHFTWWNADLGFDPYGPQPKCVAAGDIGIPGAIDSFAAATVCNMLAEIDRTLGGNGSGSDGRARAQAASLADPLPPRVAGYSRRDVLPIAGGVRIAVPANVGVALNATALNGTWTGKLVVNGPVGKQEEVIVQLRPLAAAGPTTEPLVLPVDISRVVAAGQVGRFSFSTGEAQYVSFQVGSAPGSVVSGTVRVLQGTTVLGTARFGTGDTRLTLPLPDAGSYILELEETGQTGNIHLVGSLLGGFQSETLPFPATVTDKSLPTYASYRGSFDVAASTGAHFAFSSSYPSETTKLRLLAPDGSVVFETNHVNYKVFDVLLPVAGRYAVALTSSNAAGGTFSFTSEPITWLPLGSAAQLDSSFAVVDLVADRNGKPVAGYARSSVVIDNRTSQVLQLRRWTGTTYEDVGGPISIAAPCTGYGVVAGFAFDSTNAPTIAYASSTPTNGYTVTVRRLVGGVWQPVGANDGVLVSGSTNNDCRTELAPRIVIDTSDRPIVAYHVDGSLSVQRFDAGAWGKLAPTAQDFPFMYGTFDIRLDPAGTPWLVYAADGPVSVRRFDAGSGLWQPVGPSNGVLPQQGTSSFSSVMRLLFDAAGRPVVAGTIAVGVNTFSEGVAVYRYDGTAWSTTGGYQLPDSYTDFSSVPGVALVGNDALLSWSNNNSATGSALVVQRNTPAGWSAFGSGTNGAVAQYDGRGITQKRPTSESRLLVVGSEIYLLCNVLTYQDYSNQLASRDLVLHRRVGL